MTAPPDDNTTDLHAVIAALRAERDAGLAREATLAGQLSARTTELLERKTEFNERIEYQAATNDVLKAISASPGDAQPVFDLIVDRAKKLCDSRAALYQYDGTLVHFSAISNPAPTQDELAYIAMFPMPPTRSSIACRAILEGEIIHIRDMRADPNLSPAVRALDLGSNLAVPLIRDGKVIGTFNMNSKEAGGFSDSQIELLKTFAEQAVIAITSAETYRALQTRTADLQESLEYQTATSDVLKVIGRSTFDLHPVFETIVITAGRLFGSNHANITIREGDGYRWAAGFSDLPGEAARGRFFPVDRESITGRTVLAKQVVHVADVIADPDFLLTEGVRRAGVRTVLGVPMMRDGVVVGTLNLGRDLVRPFSERQIELVRTFADQAVIAMENARLLGELRQRTTDLQESLEYQTATSDVLGVISRSTFDLEPVLNTLVETAARLCVAEAAHIVTHDGRVYRVAATFGHNPETDAFVRGLSFAPGRDTVVGRVLLDGQVVHLEDNTADPEYDVPGAVLRGAYTQLGVPLLREGDPIGVIVLVRIRVEPFTSRQIELVSTFAAQAVIAIENTRMITEQREALEQQTATAEVLQVINANPGNLTPVFDAMLEKATLLCEAPRGQLATFDGEHFRFVAVHGDAGYSVGQFAQGATRPEIGVTWPRIVAGEQVVHLADVADTDLYRAGHEGARRFVDVGSGHTLLTVALRKDDVLLGSLTVYRQEVRPFTDKQIALLKNFAAQAVIAMENARLITETQEALEQQTATAELLQTINSSPGDPAPVFDAMLDKALRLCGAAFGALRTFDGETIHQVASRNLPPRYAKYWNKAVRLDPANTVFRAAVLEQRTVQIEDMAGDESYRAGSSIAVAGVELGGVRTLVHVPLIKDNITLGVLTVFRQEVRLFSDKELGLLQNFSAQAVIAMENARLLTELRQRTDELARRNSEYGERIEQQSATIDVLEAMSASSGDAQPVFHVIVERARAFCNADNANLALVDGDMLHVQATTIIHPSENALFMAQFPRPVDATSMFGRAILARDAVQTPDVWADPQHFQRTMSGGAVPRPRGFVAVPLLRAGAPIGAIVLARNTPGEFSATQVELLRTFAEQAVIAISSAETFKELQRRTADLTRSVAELQALEEVLRAVNSSLELETVLSTIISRAVQLSDADEGTIYEYDVSEQVFVPKSAFGMSAERVAALRERRIKLGQTHLGRSAILRAPVYVEDVQQDPSVPNAGDVLPGIHAVLAVPLLRNDTVIGGLVIRRRTEKGFAETVITLMQTFSGQAVLAIENARLFREAGRARTAAEAALVDLRRAQDRLVHSEKMASLGQLTAGIAHEIKNPLNFVNNFAALSVDLLSELKETAAPGLAALTEKQRAEVEDVSAMLTSNLEKITEHGKRADGIVKAMLEHSRGSSGERRIVDLNVLIDEALNLAYHGARAQDQSFNITLERDFGEGIAPIEVNPQDITRVFLNIFSNGFYAAKRRVRDGEDAGFEPTVKVTTRDASDALEIRVRDNGTGIPADIRDKLFQPFFTTKPTGEGTGLGLSITYDIVTQQHGGSIAVDSKVGEYTEFTVRLPRSRA